MTYWALLPIFWLFSNSGFSYWSYASPQRLKFAYCFQELIQYLKYTCPAHLYATSISPPAAQQIISSIKVILGEDGSSRGIRKESVFLSDILKEVFLKLITRIWAYISILFCSDIVSLQGLKNLREYAKIATFSGQSCRKWVLRFLVIMIHQWCP